jgi:uncharacterized protein (TIGR00369 family)
MPIEPQSYFASVPFNQLLDIRLQHVDGQTARVIAHARPEFKQEQGVVHGGLLTILADNAAVYLTLPHLADEERMTSVEFKMNFLEAGRVGGGELIATARVIRAGKRIVVCEATVTQDDRKLAIGLFTYMRFTPTTVK